MQIEVADLDHTFHLSSLENSSPSFCQIGRTCAIFNVDEIIVFDDGEGEQDYNQEQFQDDEMGGGEGRDQHQNGRNGQSNFDPGAFLARVLQYLETPQ